MDGYAGIFLYFMLLVAGFNLIVFILTNTPL